MEVVERIVSEKKENIEDILWFSPEVLLLGLSGSERVDLDDTFDRLDRVN